MPGTKVDTDTTAVHWPGGANTGLLVLGKTVPGGGTKVRVVVVGTDTESLTPNPGYTKTVKLEIKFGAGNFGSETTVSVRLNTHVIVLGPEKAASYEVGGKSGISTLSCRVESIETEGHSDNGPEIDAAVIVDPMW
jgi:hypothetical protein